IGRAVKITLAMFLLLDLLFISNLMYFRPYYTAIPLESYKLLGNLREFTDSVFDSVRLLDMGFFLLTFCPGIIWFKHYKDISNYKTYYNKRAVCVHSTVIFILLFIFFLTSCDCT
ncbi:MAG: hypothetical protein LIO97_10550, partial [Tannerellaceae bacterium]|nr:hypothetical protein [Tannerellaceae bacterium]